MSYATQANRAVLLQQIRDQLAQKSSYAELLALRGHSADDALSLLHEATADNRNRLLKQLKMGIVLLLIAGAAVVGLAIWGLVLRHHSTFPWWIGLYIFNGLSNHLQRHQKRTAAVAAALAPGARSARTATLLLDILELEYFADRFGKHTNVVQALEVQAARLLPGLTHADVQALTTQQRAILRQALTPTPKSAEFTIAAMVILTELRDDETHKRLRKLVERTTSTRLKNTALECLREW